MTDNIISAQKMHAHARKLQRGPLLEKPIRWSADEVLTAKNLYEHGAQNQDIADTLNRLYRTGRTKISVGARMHQIGAVWGCRAEPDTLDPRAVKQRQCGAAGAAARNANLQRQADEETRPQPWNPVRDERPDWLRLRYGGRR